MATSKDFLNYLMEQLSGLEVRTRPMMGEYLFYYRDRLAGVVCDNCLFVKPVLAARNLLPEASMEPPYEGAKPMLVVDVLDDRALMCRLLGEMYDELPPPKPKRRRTKE